MITTYMPEMPMPY